MKVSHFFSILASVALVGWAAVMIIMVQTLPTTATLLVFIALYMALFLALVPSFSIALVASQFLFRRFRKQAVISWTFAVPRLRQSVWFSLLIISALLLLAADVFHWLTLLALVVALAVIEGLLLTRSAVTASASE